MTMLSCVVVARMSDHEGSGILRPVATKEGASR
jgi:hypothetical protein